MPTLDISGHVFFPTVFPVEAPPYSSSEPAISLVLRADGPVAVATVRCTVTTPDGTVASAEHRIFTTLDLERGAVEFIYPVNFNVGGHSIPDDIAVIDPAVPAVAAGSYRSRWENIDGDSVTLLAEHDFKTGRLPKAAAE